MTTASPASEYRYLRGLATQSRATAEQLGHPRGEQLLIAAAGRCDAVAGVFDHQPALHLHLQHLPYRRAVDLLSELVRALHAMTRIVVGYETAGLDHPRLSPSEAWAEIDALAARVDELGELAVEHAPDLGLDTVDGCSAFSVLLVDTARLDEAASTIAAAVAAARRLDQVAPAIGELSAIAADLRRRAEDLRAGRRVDWWTSYFADRAARQHTVT